MTNRTLVLRRKYAKPELQLKAYASMTWEFEKEQALARLSKHVQKRPYLGEIFNEVMKYATYIQRERKYYEMCSTKPRPSRTKWLVQGKW